MPLQVFPHELDVDGHVDDHGIRYLGKAVLQPSGAWLCLADVGGALCRVEVRLGAVGRPNKEEEDGDRAGDARRDS